MSNTERIYRGKSLAFKYAKFHGTDPDCPQDIVADLCHYWYGLGYEESEVQHILTLGFDHFTAEVQENDQTL